MVRPVNFSEQAEITQEIGRALLDAAPPEWSSLRFRYMRAGNKTQSQGVASSADGTTKGLELPSWDIEDLFDELREVMYDARTGCWFTAVITVTPDLQLSVDYDYDHEPDWFTPVDAAAYTEDLETFPRDQSTLPAWLRQKIAEARG